MLHRMRLLFLAVFAGGVAAAVFAADGALRASRPEVKKEIVAVIDAQLAAFRRGDVAKAYGYAARELRAQKPLRIFTAVVHENYPEIWASTRSEFGIAHDDGEHATVTVQVYSASGDAAYDYTLVHESAGWRINGVVRHVPRRKDNA